MQIDFVITWVDSSDTEWTSKKNKYLSELGKPMESAATDERFRDYGTLKYLLRSIEQYAPWVHKIYLITDNQRPTWLKKNLLNTKLEIVDHKDIIPNENLPTFNSNAIEMCVPNIPNLSECFVEFNDDLLINKRVEPTDFFVNGVPRDFRQYTSLYPTESYDRLRFNVSYAINRWIEKKGEQWPINKKGLFSLKYSLTSNVKNLFFLLDRHRRVSDYVLPHNAFPLRKSMVKEAQGIWEKEVLYTMKQKFRSEHDITIYLLRAFQLEKGKFIPRSPNFSHFFVLNEAEKICKELKKEKNSLLCINDSETQDYENSVKIVQKALKEKFNQKSSFEK